MTADWIPLFTKHLKDAEILKPSYAVSSFGVCKLCQQQVGVAEKLITKHLRGHARELKEYRERTKGEQERAAVERAEERRRLKEEERAVLGTGIPHEKRLANRVTSIRHKMSHPEKHGREEWTDDERAAIQGKLDEAIAERDNYKAKEEA